MLVSYSSIAVDGGASTYLMSILEATTEVNIRAKGLSYAAGEGRVGGDVR